MDDAGASIGGRLLEAGWRQCSLVRPNPAHLDLIPAHLTFDPLRERLMLVTQSCSICGVGRDNERFVEVMVVEMLPEILPAHGQAQKGAMVRELVLAVSNSRDCRGLRCNIDRRCFVPRELLLGLGRDEATLEAGQLAAFQGWMAKYYARIAVPTELVERFKRSGFQKAMQKALEKRFIKDGTGPRVHQVIDRIYIRWEPDEEISSAKIYKVWLIIACTPEHMVDAVDERILAVPHFSGDELAREGVEMNEPDVRWVGNVTLLAIDGYSRLGSWDALTGLEDHASAARSE